ncbi:MAG: Unknown protein [uncultured Thiotrichaceae bacterium]|uniref:Uncharacterized protein n=1 Tax=uncultured Thiotrichaceae bacterium TaxID=298394 RepID=A0A6S6TXD6_9GAMM|nr:MAG: Unknown protein [uncultured Thiotrichaceae bacterium]
MKSLAKNWLLFSFGIGGLLFFSTLFANDLDLQSLSFQTELQDNPTSTLNSYFGRNRALSEQFELGLKYDVLTGEKAQIGVGVKAGLPSSNALRQDFELGSSLYGNYQIKNGLDLGVEGRVNYHRLESDVLQDSVLDVDSNEVRYDVTLSLEPARLFNKPAFKNIHVKAGVSDNLLLDDSSSLREKASTNNSFDLGDDTKFYLDFDYRY